MVVNPIADQPATTSSTNKTVTCSAAQEHVLRLCKASDVNTALKSLAATGSSNDVLLSASGSREDFIYRDGLVRGVIIGIASCMAFLLCLFAIIRCRRAFKHDRPVTPAPHTHTAKGAKLTQQQAKKASFPEVRISLRPLQLNCFLLLIGSMLF